MAPENEPGPTISCHAIRLTSESELWITAPDGSQPAVIQANWLSTPEDQRTLLRMTRLMRRFMQMPALAPHVGQELLPGADVQTDEQMMGAIKKLLTSAIHATGSCRMGTDDALVVGPQLKVRGTENLRVVDCSVMPGLRQHQCTGYRAGLACHRVVAGGAQAHPALTGADLAQPPPSERQSTQPPCPVCQKQSVALVGSHCQGGGVSPLGRRFVTLFGQYSRIRCVKRLKV